MDAKARRRSVTSARNTSLVSLLARDGKVIGLAFVSKMMEVKREEEEDENVYIQRCITLVVNDNKALRELVLVNRWFLSLVEGMLDNHVDILSMPQTITAGMSDLTDEQALTIGRKLNKALRGKKTVDAGVDTWIVSNTAMVEFNRVHLFFLPMCIIIATDKLLNSPWGVKKRLYFGAFVSLFDLVTDVVAIYEFHMEGKYWYALACIIFLLVSIAVQLSIVITQHGKRGRKVLAWEIFIVVLFIKPGVDAYRAANGNVQIEGTMMDPQFELIIGKTGEIFAESIPCAVLQTYALVGRKQMSYSMLTSVIVSAGTIAYSTSTITQSSDTDPHKRLTQPAFYGK